MRTTLQRGFAWGKTILQNKRLQRIATIGLVGLGLLFIAYALYRNWNEFTSLAAQTDYRLVLLAILVYPLGMLPTVQAWRELLASLGVRSGFRTDLHIYSVSSLPRHVPGLVWYVSSRSLQYSERGVPVSRIVAASALEIALLSLSGFVSVIWLATSSAPGENLAGLRLAGWLSAAALLTLLLLLPWMNRLLGRFLAWRGIQDAPEINRGHLLASLGWMFSAWAGGALILFALVQAVYPLPWGVFPFFIGVWGASGAVSLSLGILTQGLGVREVTMGALLSLVMPPLAAGVLAVSFRLVLTVGEILWVVFFAWLTRDQPAPNSSA